MASSQTIIRKPVYNHKPFLRKGGNTVRVCRDVFVVRHS